MTNEKSEQFDVLGKFWLIFYPNKFQKDGHNCFSKVTFQCLINIIQTTPQLKNKYERWLMKYLNNLIFWADFG